MPPDVREALGRLKAMAAEIEVGYEAAAIGEACAEAGPHQQQQNCMPEQLLFLVGTLAQLAAAEGDRVPGTSNRSNGALLTDCIASLIGVRLEGCDCCPVVLVKCSVRPQL